MPDLTPKLGLKKPLGNETVSRAAYRENLDILDLNAASQSQVDQPFYLKSATYDSVGNKIDLVFGPGRAAFLGTLVAKTADSTYSISAPTVNTTYYVYLKSDGTYISNTTGAEIVGAVQIWSVATGATADVITKTDRRGQLSGGIVEMGSNANGEYVRFENGLQICWLAKSYGPPSAVYLRDTVNLPVAFIDAGYRILVGVGDSDLSGYNSDRILICNHYAPTTTSFQIRLHTSSNTIYGVVIHFGVIGKWK